MTTTPVFLSPALPSELLTYILKHHTHTTTLIICSSRTDFLKSLADDIRQSQASPAAATPTAENQADDAPPPATRDAPNAPGAPGAGRDDIIKHALLSNPLYQLATSRHVRVIYIPTVTHLRAHLSVFTPDDSKVPAPPPTPAPGLGPVHERRRPTTPLLLVYGLLSLHRDTSEWSAQGLGNSAAALVEVGHRLAWRVVLVEPRLRESDGREDVLRETAPILSGGARRMGADSDEGAWTGRMVEVGRVLKRWFRFQRGMWDGSGGDEDLGGVEAHEV